MVEQPGNQLRRGKRIMSETKQKDFSVPSPNATIPTYFPQGMPGWFSTAGGGGTEKSHVMQEIEVQE